MNKSMPMPCYLMFLVTISLAFPSATAHAQDADPAALEIIDSLSLRESDEPIRVHPRWAKPRKVAIGYSKSVDGPKEEFLSSVQSVAGEAEVVLFNANNPVLGPILDADVLLGHCGPRLLKQMINLRWIHSYSVGVEDCLSDLGVRKLDLIMTNNQRLSATSIAETALAMALMLNKGIHQYQKAQNQQQWGVTGVPMTTELSSKTMLILGLGGIGTETARRASAIGMRVIATRNSSREGPDFVEKVGLSDEMYDLAAEADVVVNALPLTKETNGLIDSKFFGALKPDAYYITVGRGGTTVTEDLINALNDGTLAGAGLDVTDPEPLPSDHPLWITKNVLITPHIAWRSIDSERRISIIARENLRRYVKGEKLLSVVDVERGY